MASDPNAESAAPIPNDETPGAFGPGFVYNPAVFGKPNAAMKRLACRLWGHRVVLGLAAVYAHGTPWPKCGRCGRWLS